MLRNDLLHQFGGAVIAGHIENDDLICQAVGASQTLFELMHLVARMDDKGDAERVGLRASAHHAAAYGLEVDLPESASIGCCMRVRRCQIGLGWRGLVAAEGDQDALLARWAVGANVADFEIAQQLLPHLRRQAAAAHLVQLRIRRRKRALHIGDHPRSHRHLLRECRPHEVGGQAR